MYVCVRGREWGVVVLGLLFGKMHVLLYKITVFKIEISLNWTLNNVFPQYYEKFSYQKLKKSYSREPIKDSNRLQLFSK